MTSRRRILPFLSLVLATALSVASQAAAQTASPVIDLATGPSLAGGSNPQQLTAVREGRVVFAATVPGSGLEVWASDGSDTGTRMLADGCPGPCSSLPEILGPVGGDALWVASGGGQPDRIWSTDGTRDGTFPLSDGGVPLTVFRKVLGGVDEPAYQPLDRALFAGRLYFEACGAVHGCGLWSTDSTVVGTRLAVPGSRLGGAPVGALAAGSHVFFLTGGVAGGNGPSLWRTDGTTAGTVLLASFPSAPRALTAAGSKLFFTAPSRDGNGEDLWVSDGTRPGTRPLTHFTPASPFTPGPGFEPVLHAAGAHVDFAADDGGHGWEIWQSDGTVGGTRRITDFRNPEPFSFFSLATSGLLEVQGRVLVQATDGATGWKLWGSTGDPGSTKPLHDCLGGCNTGSTPGHGLLGAIGGRALFLAEDAVHGTDLWSTDGTPAGTQFVRDLCPGTCSSQVPAAVPLSGVVLSFVAFPSDNSPAQLWVSDGTAAGTRPLTHFTAGSSAGDALPVNSSGRIFFSAANADGQELWVIEHGAPRQVANLAPDAPSSSPRNLTPAGSHLVFHATVAGATRLYQADGTPGGVSQLLGPVHPPDVQPCLPLCGPVSVSLGSWAAFLDDTQQSGFQLLRTDGTVAGTAQLTNVAPPDRLDLSLAALSGGTVLFFIERHDRRELWRSDGTAAGTVMVSVIPGNALSRPPAGFASTGTQAWFAINGDDGKATLWRSDGTPAGTAAAVILPAGLEVLGLPITRAGGHVFFETAQLSGTRDVQLWSTDGNPSNTAGTVPLTLGPGFGVFEMKEFNGALFYLAFGASQTGGLWRSDGTPEGTVRLHEFSLLNEDHTQVRPSGLTVAGNLLFFAAQGNTGGTELWVSDGNPSNTGGTRLVKDINPFGPDASSDPANFVAVGSRVFFSAFDGVHGIELWESDGTEAGTRLVQDIAPEGLSSSPDQLTVVGDRLYFTADDGVIGRELWSLPLNGTGGCQPSATVLCLGGGRYQVEVTWRDPQGHRGSGMAVPLTGGTGGIGDTGAFWFFSATNLELVVKVLDGTGVNGHVWVFYGALSNVEYTLTVTDTQTGLARRYFNPQGQLASVGDVQAFGPLGAKSRNPAPLTFPASVSSGGPAIAVRTDPSLRQAVCDPAPSALCLGGGRFAVTVAWKDFQGHTGLGTAVPLTGDTGSFWFFNASNLELIVKVLDGTAVNGHFWVFYGALSNVEYTLTVTDLQTGTQKRYTNPSGRFASVADTEAF
jgi:ELWxxDGT repeat protein